MRTTTYFYNIEGEIIKKHNGKPCNMEVFNANAKNAARIEVFTICGYSMNTDVFTKSEDGKWVGRIRRCNDKCYRLVLMPKRTRMAIDWEIISASDYDQMFAQEVERLMAYAREVVSWCKPEDENDADGRYWISCYHGCGVYRLIVQAGKILGSIEGGFHNSKPGDVNDEAWQKALTNIIEEKVKGEYKLVKADGSGTYFYLRNSEDAELLNTCEYDVPSARGGLHHNIEVVGK